MQRQKSLVKSFVAICIGLTLVLSTTVAFAQEPLGDEAVKLLAKDYRYFVVPSQTFDVKTRQSISKGDAVTFVYFTPESLVALQKLGGTRNPQQPFVQLDAKRLTVGIEPNVPLNAERDRMVPLRAWCLAATVKTTEGDMAAFLIVKFYEKGAPVVTVIGKGGAAYSDAQKSNKSVTEQATQFGVGAAKKIKGIFTGKP